MSDTFASINVHDIYAGGDPSTGEAVMVATGETIKPGYAIFIQSGLAYACKNTDNRVTGVAGLKEGQEIDTAYTAATDVIPWYPIGQNTQVWMYYAVQTPSAVALYEGDRVAVSATDGQIMKFSYANAAEATDTGKFIVGRIGSFTTTGSTTAVKLVLVDLGGS